MNKKRLELGFSALVLALSASVVPMARVWAEEGAAADTGDTAGEITEAGVLVINGSELPVIESEFSKINFTGTLGEFHIFLHTYTLDTTKNYRTYASKDGVTINVTITDQTVYDNALLDNILKPINDSLAATNADRAEKGADLLKNLTEEGAKIVLDAKMNYYRSDLSRDLPEGWSVEASLIYLSAGTSTKAAVDFFENDEDIYTTPLVVVNNDARGNTPQIESVNGQTVVHLAADATAEEALDTFRAINDHDVLVAVNGEGNPTVSYDSIREITTIHLNKETAIADAYKLAADLAKPALGGDEDAKGDAMAAPESTAESVVEDFAVAYELEYWIPVKGGKPQVNVLSADVLDDALAIEGLTAVYVQMPLSLGSLTVPEGKTLISDGVDIEFDVYDSSIKGTYLDKKGDSYHIARGVNADEDGGMVELNYEGAEEVSSVVLVKPGTAMDVPMRRGEKIGKITVNGEEVTGTSFTMPSTDATVEVAYVEPEYKAAYVAVMPGQSFSFEMPSDSEYFAEDVKAFWYYSGEDDSESEPYRGSALTLSHSGTTWSVDTTSALPEGAYMAMFYSEAAHTVTYVVVAVDEDEEAVSNMEGSLSVEQAIRAYDKVMNDEKATDEDKVAAKAAYEANFDSAETAQKTADAYHNSADLAVELKKTALDAEDVDDDVIEALSEKLAKEGLDGFSENMDFYDLSFMVSVDGSEVGKLTQLDKAVQITLAVEKAPDGYTRKYVVVRYHDGEVEVLDSVYNEEDGTVTFETDRFSTYATAYLDELKAGTPDTGVFTGVKSGATASAIVSAVLVGVAVSLFSAKRLFKRK